MIEAAFYDPLADDPASGEIHQVTQGQEAGLALDPRPWAPIPQGLFGAQLARTHHVVGGRVVAKAVAAKGAA